MSEELLDQGLSSWLSTYGVLTSKRILERFKIYLDDMELIAAVKNPHSVYYQLLRVPLKNVFNGIILQQGHDYLVYAQKLLIDYLLSGQVSKEEGSQGGETRENLENSRVKLVDMGEEFNKLETDHQKLIAESQANLIKVSVDLQTSLQTAAKKIKQILQAHGINKEDKLIQQAIRAGMIHYAKIDSETLAVSSPFWVNMAEVLGADLQDNLRTELANVLNQLGDPREKIETILSPYIERTEDIRINLRNSRSQFYSFILSITELVQLLPDYFVDEAKVAENRAALLFDAKLGE